MAGRHISPGDARFLPAFALTLAAAAASAQPVARPEPPRPGIEFESADLQRLQADDFSNPGMLWVEKGERLWKATGPGSATSCASCHGEASVSMRGVAAAHPQFDPVLGRVTNLEGRIDACYRQHRDSRGLAPESEGLLALSAFVAYQSRGLPIAASGEGRAREVFERGAALYRQRIGQLNLSCAQCHDANWGKRLLAETMSQGHPVGWPAYRLEWESLGTLQRRLRACFFGVRAEQPAFGSGELLALELFLAVRARGLVFDSPGVRR